MYIIWMYISTFFQVLKKFIVLVKKYINGDKNLPNLCALYHVYSGHCLITVQNSKNI